MTSPIVSVLMPVYNAEAFLVEALESLLAQTCRDFELIAIDDGSSDQSPMLLNQFAQQDSRIHINTQPENKGVSQALNIGLRLATGKYLARMDADDINLPQRLEKQVAFLEAHPEVGVLGTAATMIDINGYPLEVMEYPVSNLPIQWCLCFYCPIIHPTVMLRREQLLKAGGYTSTFPLAEDYDLWTRLAPTTQLTNLPEKLLRLRKHGSNVSITRKTEHLKNSAAISQERIRRLTGQAIPVSPLELAWEPRRISDSELETITAAILSLREHFLGQPRLDSAGKRFINRQAALQLARLTRNAPSARAAWQQTRTSLSVDPLAVGEIFQLALHKIFG
jgi:hypothetical protein